MFVFLFRMVWKKDMLYRHYFSALRYVWYQECPSKQEGTETEERKVGVAIVWSYWFLS
jgi:hypothetical protein